jgi:AcrR family transcriptional regulator
MSRCDSTRKQQILRVAEKLMRARRFHEITLDEIAQQAAIGKGTIYRYFKDKEDLFLQVALAGFDDLCALVESADEAPGPFDAHLRSICARISAFFRQRRPWFQLIQAEGGRMNERPGRLKERWISHRQKLVAALTQVIARGVQQGQIRPQPPPELLAFILLGLLRTRALDLSEATHLPTGDDVLVDLFLHGCAAERRNRLDQNRHPERNEESPPSETVRTARDDRAQQIANGEKVK